MLVTTESLWPTPRLLLWLRKLLPATAQRVLVAGSVCARAGPAPASDAAISAARTSAASFLLGPPRFFPRGNVTGSALVLGALAVLPFLAQRAGSIAIGDPRRVHT